MAIKIYEVSVAPLTAQTFIDLIDGDDVEVYPRFPYFNYPFEPAKSLPQYIACRVLLDWEQCMKYTSESKDNINDDEWEYREAAKLLNKRYVIHVDEEGDKRFNLVLFTNDEKVVEQVFKLAQKIEKVVEELEEKGIEPTEEEVLKRL